MQFKNQLNHTNLFLIFSTHSGWNIISLIDMFWDKSRDQYLKILSMCFLGEDLRHFLCWKLTSVWPKLAEKMFYNFLNNLSCWTADYCHGPTTFEGIKPANLFCSSLQRIDAICCMLLQLQRRKQHLETFYKKYVQAMYKVSKCIRWCFYGLFSHNLISLIFKLRGFETLWLCISAHSDKWAAIKFRV